MGPEIVKNIPEQSVYVGSKIENGKLLIVDPYGIKTFRLNELGTAIWKLANGKRSIENIISIISKKVDVQRDALEKDVIEFVESMHKEKLLAYLNEDFFETKVNIAGITALVKSKDMELISILEQDWYDFLSDKKPDFNVEVSFNSNLESKSKETFKTVGDKLFLNFGVVKGCIDGEKKLVMALIGGSKQNSIKTLLKSCFAFFLNDFDGFFLHAAAAIKDNKCFVFFGKSGSGKTTIAETLRKNSFVLSDEVVAVRKIKDSFYCFGMPFFGAIKKPILNNNTKALIDSAYLLKKDKKSFVAELGKADALKEFMACVMHLSKNSERTKKIFRLCSEFVEKKNCQELHFSKNAAIFGVIE